MLSSLPQLSDMPALARGELTALLASCEEGAGRGPDDITRRHLNDIAARIRLVLEKIRVEQKQGSG